MICRVRWTVQLATLYAKDTSGNLSGLTLTPTSSFDLYSGCCHTILFTEEKQLEVKPDKALISVAQKT